MRYPLLFSLLLVLCACSSPGPMPVGHVAELQRIDEKTGSGATATSGSDVSVHYTGWIYDERAAGQRGQEFDTIRLPVRLRVRNAVPLLRRYRPCRP